MPCSASWLLQLANKNIRWSISFQYLYVFLFTNFTSNYGPIHLSPTLHMIHRTFALPPMWSPLHSFWWMMDSSGTTKILITFSYLTFHQKLWRQAEEKVICTYQVPLEQVHWLANGLVCSCCQYNPLLLPPTYSVYKSPYPYSPSSPHPLLHSFLVKWNMK